MKTIFLIRHAEQLKGIHDKQKDSQISNEKVILSVKGEKQAEEISKRKELQNITSVWSSQYVRAIATAKYIAYQNQLDIQVDERLNERKLRKFGSFKKARRSKK